MLPGFVDISTSVEGTFTPESIGQLGSKALAGGVTLVCIHSEDQPILSEAKQHLKVQLSSFFQSRFLEVSCMFYLGLYLLQQGAVSDFCQFLSPSQASSEEAMLSAAGMFFSLPSAQLSLPQLSTIFEQWPTNRPLIAQASGPFLATVLFFASLHNRSVHITQVSSRQDLMLVIASKEKGIQVTCDISVFSLFYTKQDCPHSNLGTKEDLDTFWASLEHIDCLSSGDAARQLSKLDKKSPLGKLEDMLPLLLTAVAQNRLSLKDVVLKIHDNPLRILNLPPQNNTFVTVEMDKEITAKVSGVALGTPAKGDLQRPLRGLVTRVVVRDETVYLDGHVRASPGTGKEISRDLTLHADHTGPRVKRRKLSIVSDLHDMQSPPSSQGPTSMDIQSPPPKFAIDSGADSRVAVTDKRKMSRYVILVFIQVIATYTLYPPSAAPSFYLQHITSVDKFSRGDLHNIFGVAQEMKIVLDRDTASDLLRGKVCASVVKASPFERR